MQVEEMKRCPKCGGFHSIGQIDSIIAGVMDSIDKVIRESPEQTRNEAEKAYDRMKERGVMLSDASFADVDNSLALFILSFQSLQNQTSMVVQTIEKSPIAACAFLSVVRDSAYNLSRSCTDLITSLQLAINAEMPADNEKEDQVL